MPDTSSSSSSFVGNTSTISKIESFLRASISNTTGSIKNTTNFGSVKRKPIPTTLEEYEKESDTASTSSLSYSASLRMRKPSQTSSLLDWASVSSMETKQKSAAEIMLHLDENKLNDLLEEMLDQMGLDEGKRSAVRNMPKDSKWMMVYQHMQKQDTQASHGHVKGSPEYYVRALKELLIRGLSSNPTSSVKTLNAIRVSLANQPITWVKQFIDKQGLSHLLDLIDKLTQKRNKKDAENLVEGELIKCVKSFMNNKQGLLEVMSRAPSSIRTLTRCLLSSVFPVSRQAPELLTVICYTDSPHGHNIVIEAMEEQSIYPSWMQLLSEIISSREKVGGGSKGGIIAGAGWVGDTRVSDKEIVEYLISNMILINALVTMANDVDYRMHIRNRFYQVGFSNIFLKLQELSQSNEILRRQVEKFRLDLSSDWEMYKREFEELKQDMNDPENLLRSLIRKVEGTRGYNHLISILQHLLAIRRDSSVRSSYLQLIDLIVSQIVLNNKGLDPDFSSSYPIDLQIIVDNFVHHDDLTRINHENALLKQMLDQLIEDKSRLEQIVETMKMSADGVIFTGSDPGELSLHLNNHQTRLNEILAKLSNSREPLLLHHETVPEMMESSENATLSTEVELSKSKQNLSPSSPPTPNKSLETEHELIQHVQNIPLPPPPPPIPSMQNPLPKKQGKPPVYIPRSKMKQFQWEKIADYEIEKTFWAQSLPESEKEIGQKLKGIWEDLEIKFCQNQQQNIPTANNDNNNLVERKREKSNSDQGKLSILDSKKAYNIMILLSRSKYSLSELTQAIYEMNTSILTQSLIQQLIRYFPTAEESALLSPYLYDEAFGMLQDLSRADRFMVEMLRVEKSILRLKSMSFRFIFDERFYDLENGLQIVSEATETVSQNSLFKEFLQLLLVIGNVMNGKGFRGGAYGFKISSLNSLNCTRSSVTGETLMDYISGIIRTNFPHLTRLPEELEESVAMASRISLQHLSEEFQMLWSISSQLDSEMTKSGPSPDDYALMNAKDFIKRTLSTLEKLKSQLEVATNNFNDLLLTFGDDPKEVSSEDWFGRLKSFFSTMKKSLTKPKKQSRNEKPLQNAYSVNDDDKIGGEKGVMDDLMQSLRNGTMKKQPEKIVRCTSSDYSNKASELLIQLNHL